MSQTVTLQLLPQTTFSHVLAPAIGVGTISNNVLYITSVTSGTFGVGQTVRGNNIAVTTTITSQLTGVGGVGTYTVTPGTQNVLTPTGFKSSGVASSYNVVGTRQAAASYYLGCKTLQTVNISTTGFTGTIIIEASLFTDPSDSAAEPSNWFEVYRYTANSIGAPGSQEAINSSRDMATNIEGGYVWIRARVQDFTGGIVNWVKVSY